MCEACKHPPSPGHVCGAIEEKKSAATGIIPRVTCPCVAFCYDGAVLPIKGAVEPVVGVAITTMMPENVKIGPNWIQFATGTAMLRMMFLKCSVDGTVYIKLHRQAGDGCIEFMSAIADICHQLVARGLIDAVHDKKPVVKPVFLHPLPDKELPLRRAD